ncbi:MAG: glycosyl hydrolase family 32 [Candidatus Abyssobacteria bacterium SURF_17]|jgi:beta-fructofuranosidase|uniref:beta-fructofuranosidase n=1 Tax=Candidatus Abyssobacteria bacterium SURF_17 TaxID=2093361 RepID=A0A419EZX2_9BACT|nr:MAG: glycosyl hydrolase family 32 [Candidatus Abyssubacteria bacterium SURF_17]
MYYSPPGQYLWDFWLIFEASEYHLFHLQAPRSLPDPEMRHNHAAIGHAVSADLRSWRDKGLALASGKPGEWDDLSVWTGSVIKKGTLYYMLYTGRCRAEQGTIQRIGLARSSDLYYWEKYAGNPILEADGRYYEKLTSSEYYEEAWRDPYLFYDHATRCHYAFISARAGEGKFDERGCIALAKSDDLIHWEVLPPPCCPGTFGMMEVPQVFQHGGRTYLLFSTMNYWYAESHRARMQHEPWDGDHYLISDALLGEYRCVGDGVLSRANHYAYASKVVNDAGGKLYLLSWLSRVPGGDAFAGVLSPPQPLSFAPDGTPCISP